MIKVDRESLRVIDQNGSVRNVLPTQIANKLAPRRDAVATDRNGAEIRNGDTVREVYGEQRSGVISHIYRSFLFLHNKAQTENAGISVVRTTNVVTVSARGGRSTGPDLTKMNPALAMQTPGGGNNMPPPRRVGRDRLIGKTITVRKGRYKGLVGIVRDSDDKSATVELYTTNKPVLLPRDILVPKEYVLLSPSLILQLLTGLLVQSRSKRWTSAVEDRVRVSHPMALALKEAVGKAVGLLWLQLIHREPQPGVVRLHEVSLRSPLLVRLGPTV